MRQSTLRILAAAGVFITAACSATLPRVPIAGASDELLRMAGEWRGEYSSSETGRAGSILFQLSASADSAFGDVLMVPRTPLGVSAPERGGAEARPLTIRFVRVTGDLVSGAMDPYADPECSCVLHTTFTGRLEGDRLRGTFTTRGPERTTAGTWSARRHP